jgi:hypothetical protein
MTFYQKYSVSDSTQFWTEKHEEFCLENRVTPSAKLLWQWLMRQGELGNESEPDLKEFNEWVAKHRGKRYSIPTLKGAFEQLANLRIIYVAKKFTWRIYRLIVRPLEWLFPKKRGKFRATQVKLVTNNIINFYVEKNFQKPNKTFNLQPSKPQLSEPGLGSSSNPQSISSIQENVDTLQSAGIDFDHDDTEVVTRPHSEIRLALIMFELRGGFEKISNPEGWVRTCLRTRIWEEPRNYEYLLSKFGNLTIWDELFSDERKNIHRDTGLIKAASIN